MVLRRVDQKEHAERVASSFPPGSVEWQVALYHDHLEDKLGMVPTSIIHHVETLTRDEDESYEDYIKRIKRSGDEVAIAVKLADARDNLARCNGEFDGVANPLRARRYEYVIAQLEGVGG